MSSFYQEVASRGFLSNQSRIDLMRIIFKNKIDLMRTTASISRLITCVNERDEGDIIIYFGIVTDDDDNTTRVYDDEVIPPLKVMALNFTNAARARIENAGGTCLSFHQVPLAFRMKFLSDFPKLHDTMLIFKSKNNNNPSSSSNQTTMRNVRRRIQGVTRSFMDNLNDDLFCEILIRLSPKTLGRLKVINKRWHSFISDPSFVSKHTTSLLQTEARGGHSTFISVTFEHISTLLSFEPNLLSETTFTLSLPAESYYGPPVMMPQPAYYGSGRGLLLVRTGYNSCYIYNPLTKKNRPIPFPYKMFIPNYGIIFGGSTSSGQYDYNNHYTLVCLVESYKAYKFMIFLSKKNRWIHSNKSSRLTYGINGLKRSIICREILPVCSRRIIHWLTRGGYIIAFNLDKEESRIIEIPKCVLAIEVIIDWWYCTWFGVLEDEVILVVATSKHEIVTWVLHDYENNKWKIKRKDVINPGSVPVVHIRPLFFDGQRFLLSMTTNINYTNINYKSRCRVRLRMEHDVQTGVSKFLRFEGISSLAGSSVCFPITSTLTEV